MMISKDTVVQNTTEDLSSFFPKAQEIIADDDFWKRLTAKEPLRIKAGFDPTAPDLHLGHTILFDQLKRLQDLGHQVSVIIGDFTAKIGDPTGKNITRPSLSEAVIQENLRTYCDQVFKILDREKTQLLFNSQWLKDLGTVGLIQLASHYTVARMLERDDFQKRFSSGKPIAVHEFLYPLLQGYDSVVLDADIEIGGMDQKFNLLVGRELQRSSGKKPQAIVMMPLLEGLDGVHKMSKSLGNCVSITDQPDDMFGKIMSISDALMWRYMDLLSVFSFDEMRFFRDQVALSSENPRNIKILVAKKIITRYWSAVCADKAEQAFIEQFVFHQVPANVPEKQICLADWGGTLSLVKALKLCDLVGSHSEAVRMIDQQAVRLNQERIIDKQLLLPAGRHLLQVGKRKFCWISVESS